MNVMKLGSRVLAVAILATSCSGDADTAGPTTSGPRVTAPATSPAPTTMPATTMPATTMPEPPASAELPTAYVGHTSDIYVDDAHWLCLPGKADNVCDSDLDATVVHADGSVELEAFVPAVDPIADCFYVYPTTSNDPGANSDLIPAEAEEISTVLNQAARLGAACRVFAPMYRQWTLTALTGAVESDDSTRERAYADVVDAFRYFIANLADDRPFVVVGHSQGAGILRELVAQEIDNEPLLRDRLVSAILLGTSVATDGFENISPCESATDTTCLVSYSSYRDREPPPENGFFGRTAAGPAVCVNPAAPGGGVAIAAPYFVVRGQGGLSRGAQPFDDPDRTAEIRTPFVVYPDMVSVECVEDGQFGYLRLGIVTDDGPRTDDIGGDLTPEWGMHLVDANVAMGDLVRLVESQSSAMG